MAQYFTVPRFRVTGVIRATFEPVFREDQTDLAEFETGMR